MIWTAQSAMRCGAPAPGDDDGGVDSCRRVGFATVFTLFLTRVFFRLIAPLGAPPGRAAHKLTAEKDAVLVGT